MRRNDSQAVAAELFGCSRSGVSRIVRRLRPLLLGGCADLAGQVRAQAKISVVLVDGLLAPTGDRASLPDLHSGKRHTSGLNVDAVAGLPGAGGPGPAAPAD
jgi:hypothetical protein